MFLRRRSETSVGGVFTPFNSKKGDLFRKVDTGRQQSRPPGRARQQGSAAPSNRRRKGLGKSADIPMDQLLRRLLCRSRPNRRRAK